MATSTKAPRFHKVSRFADRGKKAETLVAKALTKWADAFPAHREVNRLIDTRAAQRIVKAAPADFDFYAAPWGVFGLIEVKETKHDYRLAKDKVPQLPRLIKRSNAGGICGVVVFHSELNMFRGVSVQELQQGSDKGSWNLTPIPLVPTPEEALAQIWHGFSK